MVGERVERRLTAILAADVAGYSRLMGKPSSGGHGSFPRTPTRHIPRPSALASVPAGIGDENNVGRPLWRPGAREEELRYKVERRRERASYGPTHHPAKDTNTLFPHVSLGSDHECDYKAYRGDVPMMEGYEHAGHS